MVFMLAIVKTIALKILRVKNIKWDLRLTHIYIFLRKNIRTIRMFRRTLSLGASVVGNLAVILTTF